MYKDKGVSIYALYYVNIRYLKFKDPGSRNGAVVHLSLHPSAEGGAVLFVFCRRRSRRRKWRPENLDKRKALKPQKVYNLVIRSIFKKARWYNFKHRFCQVNSLFEYCL